MYINVGVKYQSDWSDIPTKAALKRTFAENPGNVHLYDTSLQTEGNGRNGTELEIGVKYSVTGPNPYTNRKWYATVEKLQNGKITVK